MCFFIGFALFFCLFLAAFCQGLPSAGSSEANGALGLWLHAQL